MKGEWLMKTILATFIFLGISFGFPQENSTNTNNQQETMTDDQLFEKYVQESRKLDEEFIPIFDRLKDDAWIQKGFGKQRDAEKWYREYDQPLFEAAKSARKRLKAAAPHEE